MERIPSRTCSTFSSRSCSLISDFSDKMLVSDAIWPMWTNNEHLDTSLLSFSDTRKLAAIREKEKHYEMLMNTQKAFDMGYFPGGYRRVGTAPPFGYLGALRQEDLALVEWSWNHLLKDMDRHGVRLMVHCLKKNDGGRKILKRLKTKTRLCKTKELYGHPLAVCYGRRLVIAITTLIVNARNDNSLKAYVSSLVQVLLRFGLKTKHLEELGCRLINFVHTVLQREWTESLTGAWDTFRSELLRIALPFMSTNNPGQ